MDNIIVKVDGPIMSDLSEREVVILQNTILNLAAMTNALIIGKGVMLNPLEEEKIGIIFVYPDEIPNDKEDELKVKFIKKLNTFFKMSNLNLTAQIAND